MGGCEGSVSVCPRPCRCERRDECEGECEDECGRKKVWMEVSVGYMGVGPIDLVRIGIVLSLRNSSGWLSIFH